MAEMAGSNTCLTDRQYQVVCLVACGLTNAEIACRLGIRPRTVKDHLKAVSHRLGTQCRLDMALVAIVRGWVTQAEVANALEPRVRWVAEVNRCL
jgi:DNA-binding NarL/FixJ family response regulator